MERQRDELDVAMMGEPPPARYPRESDLRLQLRAAPADISNAAGTRVIVSLRNQGAEPVQVAFAPPWALYHVSVMAEDGSPVEKTQRGAERARAGQSGYRALEALRPGAVKEEELDLAESYDLSPKAAYAVTVARDVYTGGDPPHVRVVSNAITIRVGGGR
jgi:hypothetical protein